MTGYAEFMEKNMSHTATRFAEIVAQNRSRRGVDNRRSFAEANASGKFTADEMERYGLHEAELSVYKDGVHIAYLVATVADHKLMSIELHTRSAIEVFGPGSYDFR